MEWWLVFQSVLDVFFLGAFLYWFVTRRENRSEASSRSSVPDSLASALSADELGQIRSEWDGIKTQATRTLTLLHSLCTRARDILNQKRPGFGTWEVSEEEREIKQWLKTASNPAEAPLPRETSLSQKPQPPLDLKSLLCDQ